jgi:hypothetical protein
MGIFNRARAETVSVVADTVVNAASGIADIVDRFVHTNEEKAEMKLVLKEHELKIREQAMLADAAILADRQSARAMAGQHGKLQTTFAITFLIGFLALLVGDLAFIGWLIAQSLAGGETLAEWLQILVSNTLTGVLAYMVSMLKEVVGFLFGGSAGGDDREAMLTETLRNSGGQTGNDE